MPTINAELESVISFCGESVTVTVDGVKTWKDLVNAEREMLGLTTSEISELNFFAGSDILSPNAVAIAGKVVICAARHEEKGLG